MATIKKIILFALTALIMTGCRNSTSTNKVNNKVNETPNKYEVLLSTKDTIYVEAVLYYMYHGNFGECVFEDKYGNIIQVIHNPVYIKEIRDK